MTFFARLIGLLTVLLSLGLMAVSAYAAQQQEAEQQAAAGASAALQAEQQAASSSVSVAGPSFWATLDDEAKAPFIQEAIKVVWERAALEDGADPSAIDYAAPKPTAELHFAAPAEAVAVSGPVASRNQRSDLSPAGRIGGVPGIRPLPASGQLGAAGLEIPVDQLLVMQQVSQRTGIPWQILAAIAKVESDFGRNMSTSWAGAIGYGQFLPEMWDVFGAGGDPYDFRDVLPAMARYLLAAGAPQDIPDAVFAYNHDWGYVAQVLSYAAAYTLPPSSTGGLIWPVTGPISTYFGPHHQGIDIDQTMKPGAPVLAAHDGVVLFAGGDPCCSYGLYVILVSPSGLSTLYGHFSRIIVSPGETVRQGQALGIVGCTGHCTGTHVHFEVIDGDARRNPLDYLP